MNKFYSLYKALDMPKVLCLKNDLHVLLNINNFTMEINERDTETS